MTTCEECGQYVKDENLLRHYQNAHPKLPTPKGQIIRPRRQKAPVSRKTKKIAGIIIAVIALVGLAVVFGPSIGLLPPSQGNFPFPCVNQDPLFYHRHTQLTITDSSGNVVVPAQIGIAYNCMEPLHTHDTSGTIHVETDVNRLYTIGDFFKVWNRPFGTPSQMLVNGTAMTPTASQPLWDQETISLTYSGGF